MKNGSKNTETLIMESAEELFLLNGYHLTTTTMIARKAGVTHAMLHYYFRTKDQIFLKVTEKYFNGLLEAIHPAMNMERPFMETVKDGISAYFDFFSAHRHLPGFIYDVLRFSPEVAEKFTDRILERAAPIFKFHSGMIANEISEGRMNSVDPAQLLFSIVTMTLSTFMSIDLIRDKLKGDDDERFIEARKLEIIESVRLRLYGNVKTK